MGKVVKTPLPFGGVTADYLDGLMLIEGERVAITWSNGDKGEYSVYLDNRIDDRLAYIVVPFHGTTNRVYLRWKTKANIARAVVQPELPSGKILFGG